MSCSMRWRSSVMASLLGTGDGMPGRASIYCSWGSLLLLAGILRQLTAPDERQPPALALLLYRVSGLVQGSVSRECFYLDKRRLSVTRRRYIRGLNQHKFSRDHKDWRNASRSALGFQGLAFAGLMPA